MMKWYNFHRTHPDQLDAIVNAHIKRGYELHSVYRNATRADVSFVIELPQERWDAKFAVCCEHAARAVQARDAKAQEERARKEARQALAAEQKKKKEK